MPRCFFATDLHGHVDRYEKLFACIIEERPAAVFLGGDLLPGLPSRWIASPSTGKCTSMSRLMCTSAVSRCVNSSNSASRL